MLGIISVILYINILVGLAMLVRGVFRVVGGDPGKRDLGRREVVHAVVGVPVMVIILLMISPSPV